MRSCLWKEFSPGGCCMWLGMPSNEWTISLAIYWDYETPQRIPFQLILAPTYHFLFLPANLWSWIPLLLVQVLPSPTFLAPGLTFRRTLSQVQTSQRAVLPWITLPSSAAGASRRHLHLAEPPSMLLFVTVFSLPLQWLTLRAFRGCWVGQNIAVCHAF